MILKFWYSANCTRQMKMIASIGTCLIIYLCSIKAELSPWLIGLSLGIGIMVHLIYSVTQSKLKASKYHHFLYLIPLLTYVVLILNLTQQGWFYLAVQCLGFGLLGFFIVTLYENRAPR